MAGAELIARQERPMFRGREAHAPTCLPVCPATLDRRTHTAAQALFPCVAPSKWHTPPAPPCYVLGVGGPEPLGRSTCRPGGGLVSQGRKERNARSGASFGRNEGEDTCWSDR